MNSVRYASNRTRLAQVLGLGRTLLYRFTRLPDAPAPRVDGRHDVVAWRKFLATHASKVKDMSEGDALKIALLKIRLEREQLEFAQLNNDIRESITSEISAAAYQVIEVLKTQVQRMPDELSGRFCGLEAMAIYKLFKSELHQRFQRAHDALQKLQAQSKRKTRSKKEGSNIVEFRTAAATGGR